MTMINIIIQIAIASIAIYFVHDESGIATAIVIGYVLLSLSAISWLYNDKKQKFNYLLRALKTSNNLISNLENKVYDLTKSNEDLVMYSKRHEKWLDGIDSRLPNLNNEE